MKTHDQYASDYEYMIDMFNRQYDYCPTNLKDFPMTEQERIDMAYYEALAVYCDEQAHGTQAAAPNHYRDRRDPRTGSKRRRYYW